VSGVKVHWRRVVIDLALTMAAGAAFAAFLEYVMNAATWVQLLSCMALGWAISRARPSWVEFPPFTCYRCTDGRHIHNVNGGECINRACKCEVRS
jgi:hypothetical protein